MTTSRQTLQKPNINEPVSGLIPLNFSELWKYRDLFLFLSWRNLRVRYKQSILGIGWALLQPVTNMIVFSIIFGEMAQISTGGIPYPIFSYAGLLPWTLFTTSISSATQSLVSNSAMVKKIYFPRLILPLSFVLTALVDFVISFLLLLALMLYYGFPLTLNIIWLPVFIFLTSLASIAFSIWLSALNVWVRDIQHLIPLIIRVGLFFTPALYPASLVKDEWKLLYSLNPLVGIIEGFRWAILGTGEISIPSLILSNTLVVILLVLGLYYFRRAEMSFADVI